MKVKFAHDTVRAAEVLKLDYHDPQLEKAREVVKKKRKQERQNKRKGRKANGR